MRAVGAPFTLKGIGAHPLIARLRQHVVPPQPPKLVSIRVHPPNPPPGGLSCSLLPFAVQYISDQISQQSTSEMDWCLSSRPVPAARRKASFQQTTWPRQGRAGQGRAGQGRAGQGRAGRAGQGRAGQGRAGQNKAEQGKTEQSRAWGLGAGAWAGQGRAGQSRAGQGRAGQAGQGRAGQITSTVVGLGSPCCVIRGAASLQSSYTGRFCPPSPSCRDARPGASVGASSALANGQRRSRQFRVEGLGLRV